MIDQPRASQLAKQAFDLWQEGLAENAVPLYQEALQCADPQHYGLSQYHGEFASVLSTLGRHAEAREQLRCALDVQKRQDKNEFTSGVVVARYFLAAHFLQSDEPLLSLETIGPSLKEGVELEWLLRYVKAIALHALGRIDEARSEALATLEKVYSDKKHEELSKLFAEKGML